MEPTCSIRSRQAAHRSAQLTRPRMRIDPAIAHRQENDPDHQRRDAAQVISSPDGSPPGAEEWRDFVDSHVRRSTAPARPRSTTGEQGRPPSETLSVGAKSERSPARRSRRSTSMRLPNTSSRTGPSHRVPRAVQAETGLIGQGIHDSEMLPDRRRHWAVQPPSIGIAAPVRLCAAGSHSHSTMRAISSGVDVRRSAAFRAADRGCRPRGRRRTLRRAPGSAAR